MTEQSNPLRQWADEIRSLSELWPSLSVVCIAHQQGNAWVNLIGQLELSWREPEDLELTPVVEVGQLVALTGTIPIGALEQYLDSLSSGFVLTGGAYFPIALNADSASKGHWRGPAFRQRRLAERDHSIDFAASVCHFTGFDWTALLAGNRERLDKQLRIGRRPFDGLDGVARSLRLTPLPEHGNSYFDVLAPIPLRFDSVEQNLVKKTLSVTVEAAQTVDHTRVGVSGISRTNHGTVAFGDFADWRLRQRADFRCFSRDVHLEKPHGVLRLVLAYGETEIELHDCHLASKDCWLRAVEFFDPEFKNTNDLLISQRRIQVNTLELGCTRLLAACGLRVAWFGKAAAERRSDALAYCEAADGRKILLLVECTEEKVGNKFDSLVRQSNELADYLSEPNALVVPVVFTNLEPTSAEIKQALEKKIAILGKYETAQIWNALRSDQSSEQIVNYISGLRSSFGHLII